jgi:N-acetylglucosaminyl-diphospho-decaprenol L-rhamnosyltransferase
VVHPPIADPSRPISVVVVTHESSSVIGPCLRALARAAPRRGVAITVVDNASSDDSAAVARLAPGVQSVIRLEKNRGFASGVNAGLRDAQGEWAAIVNPDTELAADSLDRLADILERHPRAALVGPRIRLPNGSIEPSVGAFPTLGRERAHAYFLDRLLRLPGRRAQFPSRTGVVDWVSGCAWLARLEAVRATGPLDEGYFMYVEDIDYCWRLHTRGWSTLATPDVEVLHRRGEGSRDTRTLPADGGLALVRFFEKFRPTEVNDLRRALMWGWRVRRLVHRVRARLGSRSGAVLARRYDIALEAMATA